MKQERFRKKAGMGSRSVGAGHDWPEALPEKAQENVFPFNSVLVTRVTDLHRKNLENNGNL